jgi:hypothetical protein
MSWLVVGKVYASAPASSASEEFTRILAPASAPASAAPAPILAAGALVLTARSFCANDDAVLSPSSSSNENELTKSRNISFSSAILSNAAQTEETAHTADSRFVSVFIALVTFETSCKRFVR